MADSNPRMKTRISRAALSATATWIGMIAAVAAVPLAIPVLTESLLQPSAEFDSAIIDAKVRVRTDQLRREMDQLRHERDALRANSSKSEDATPTKLLLQRLQSLEERQGRIEKAILGDPQKALELPLLRRDLDSIKEANATGLASVQQSVDQVYDLSKWLLGALVVGIFSLALSNFLRAKE